MTVEFRRRNIRGAAGPARQGRLRGAALAIGTQGNCCAVDGLARGGERFGVSAAATGVVVPRARQGGPSGAGGASAAQTNDYMSVQSSDRLSNNGSGAGDGIGGLPNDLDQGRVGQGRVVSGLLRSDGLEPTGHGRRAEPVQDPAQPAAGLGQRECGFEDVRQRIVRRIPGQIQRAQEDVRQ